MIAYICDRCGKTIPDRSDRAFLQIRNAYGEMNDEIMVCPDCLKEYVKWKKSKVERSEE